MLLKPEFDPPVKSVEDFLARNMTLSKSIRRRQQKIF